MSESEPANLPFKERRWDIFFAIAFALSFLTSCISDALPTLGVELRADSDNFLARANFSYAFGCDPLFLHAPVWMRFVTGLSTFVYGPFYLVLVYALIKGRNWIQFPSTIYATLITGITGIVVFGVEFFGEPQWRCQNIPKFLSYNIPYVLVPLLLLIRMRKPLPFTRKF